MSTVNIVSSLVYYDEAEIVTDVVNGTEFKLILVMFENIGNDIYLKIAGKYSISYSNMVHKKASSILARAILGNEVKRSKEMYQAAGDRINVSIASATTLYHWD